MKSKKRLAASILKISPKKVKFAFDALNDIKKAITRSDIRGLIAVNKITKSGANEQSRSRARKIATQKSKGRQKGPGTKKGSKNASVSRKEKWMARVRVQRDFIKELKEKEIVTPKNYRMLYRKVKGGYFRNRRHIKLYINDYHLVEKKENQ